MLCTEEAGSLAGPRTHMAACRRLAEGTGKEPSTRHTWGHESLARQQEAPGRSPSSTTGESAHHEGLGQDRHLWGTRDLPMAPHTPTYGPALSLLSSQWPTSLGLLGARLFATPSGSHSLPPGTRHSPPCPAAGQLPRPGPLGLHLPGALQEPPRMHPRSPDHRASGLS
ncbi:hypothetical protein HJG60_010735 [Phyllostomus discolor]|uniref:Uncharacterized protein n=1 Tax=Phyllostomus discolor TaxID=89673 RepID=A0A834AH68_9CHIR|nr:hypothetical protein HJG60_010735 [Phyllostomus discolor]